MARMHKRTRGSSGSTRPRKELEMGSQKWLAYSKKEVREIIVKLAKNNYSQAEIGAILRDRYGIPSIKAMTGQKLQKVLEENQLTKKIPEDLQNLLDKAANIRAHLKKYPKDLDSKRQFELTEAKIIRLGKYYIKKGTLPVDWKFSRS